MRCPSCGSNEDKVLDTRTHGEGRHVRRKRECLQCKARFNTIESLVQEFPQVIKKDGRREEFSKEKILSGLQAACQKRPVSRAQLEQIVEKLTKWILDGPEKEVSTDLIGKRLMTEIKDIDDVAYVRFASVYRNFRDLKEFVESLETDGKTWHKNN